MVKDLKKQTEKFWSGSSGNQYILRTNNSEHLKSNISFFKRVIKKKYKIKNILEFGCNIGLNLEAINYIDKKINLTGVDINKQAIDVLKSKNIANAYKDTLYNFKTRKKFDLTFTKGVLIHIPPKHLSEIYQKLFNYSNKYILIAEYFSPKPTKIKYRGFSDLLYKRDFAKDLIKKYNMDLVDYGFVYSLDKKNPLDDINWFLLKKKV